ncbi:hypothetical protein ACH4NT_36480 [Streptomyces lydicus]|uniref:hypothetical protein n=1 Tax=Streptomyces lydicus TaxID=47763 RepID=UPI0037A4B632
MTRLTLEGLEDQLDELVMLVSAVTEDGLERTDRLEKAVGTLREQLQELIEHVAATEAEDAGEEEPASWVERATPEAWVALADWVDWLQSHYEVSGEHRLPPCWPRHKGAVEELAALQGSWKNAMLADMKAEGVGDAAVYWHDRYRGEGLRRACSSINRACFNTGHTEPKPVPATDRGALPSGA